jgi:hypothetical protein
LPYPAACHPQAWTAATSVGVLSALVGIEADIPNNFVRFAPLATPTGLHSVDGFRVGSTRVAVQIGPDGQAVVTGAPPGLRVYSHLAL